MNRIFLLLLSNIIIINITYAHKEQTTFISIAGNAIYTFIISLNPNYERNKNKLYNKKKEHKETEKNDGEVAFFIKKKPRPDIHQQSYHNACLFLTMTLSFMAQDYRKCAVDLYKIVTGHEAITIENPIIAAHITNPSDIDLYLNNGYMLVNKCKDLDEELK